MATIELYTKMAPTNLLTESKSSMFRKTAKNKFASLDTIALCENNYF